MSHDKELLKKLYQRAMMICHPDRLHNVPERLRPFLETKAKELNAAYDAGSFARVRKIAEELGVKDIPPMPKSESVPKPPQPKSESAPYKSQAKPQQHARKSQESTARTAAPNYFWENIEAIANSVREQQEIKDARVVLMLVFGIMGFFIGNFYGITVAIIGGILGLVATESLLHYFPKVAIMLWMIFSSLVIIAVFGAISYAIFHVVSG